jgi:hypothetical protein
MSEEDVVVSIRTTQAVEMITHVPAMKTERPFVKRRTTIMWMHRNIFRDIEAVLCHGMP